MMPRLLLKLGLLTLLLLMPLAAAASRIGAMMPANPLLETFTAGCAADAKSCVFGIVADTTTLSTAKAELIRSGFSQLSDYQFTDRLSTCNASLHGVDQVGEAERHIVHRVQVDNLYTCSTLRLGDLMARYGKIVQVSYANPFYLSGGNKRGGLLTLEGGVTVAALYDSRFGGWFSPQSQILYLYAFNYAITGYPWYGFTSLAHYCRRIPDADMCVG